MKSVVKGVYRSQGNHKFCLCIICSPVKDIIYVNQILETIIKHKSIDHLENILRASVDAVVKFTIRLVIGQIGKNMTLFVYSNYPFRQMSSNDRNLESLWVFIISVWQRDIRFT